MICGVDEIGFEKLPHAEKKFGISQILSMQKQEPRL